MQPVQLSLIPDQVPEPPRALIVELPAQHVAAAVAVLAHLIAKSVNPALPATAAPEAVDE